MVLVLADHRGAFAGVPHPGHQVPEPDAALGRELVPGVVKVVNCRLVMPIATATTAAFGQAGILLKLPRRGGPPLTPRE